MKPINYALLAIVLVIGFLALNALIGLAGEGLIERLAGVLGTVGPKLITAPQWRASDYVTYVLVAAVLYLFLDKLGCGRLAVASIIVAMATVLLGLAMETPGGGL